MKSNYFEAVIFDRDVYCIDCLPPGVTVNDNDVIPIFASDKWRCYPTCCVCGRIHDYVNITPFKTIKHKKRHL